MNIADVILTIILVVIAGAAIRYIYKAKKRGTKCIGCPYSGECASKEKCGSNKKTL